MVNTTKILPYYTTISWSTGDFDYTIIITFFIIPGNREERTQRISWCSMQMWRKIPSCWIQWNFTRNIRETKWWWSTLVQRFKYLYPLFQYTVLEKNRIVSFTVFTRKVRFLLKFYLWFLKGWTCHQFLKWSQVHFRLSLRRLCPLNCSWSGWFSRQTNSLLIL